MVSGIKGDGAVIAPSRGQSLKLAIINDWNRILEGDGWGSRLVTILLLVVFFVGSGVLLSPRAYQVIPYDEDDLGRFVVGTVKAHRNYRIEDHQASKHKRLEAREHVLAVYDHDVEALEQTLRRVRESFSYMQRVWNDHQRDLASRVVEADSSSHSLRVEGRFEDLRVDSGASSILEAELYDDEAADQETLESEDSKAALIQVEQKEGPLDKTPLELFSEHKNAFLQLLQLPLDDSSFAFLSRERFSPDIEQAISRLVRESMARPIIADRRLLASDEMRGIMLRPVPGRDVRREREIRDVVGEVYDLATARALLTENLAEVMESSPVSTRALVGRLARRLVRPTIVFNRDETERRRDEAEASVRPTFIELEAGEKIIGDGERLEQRHLVIFKGIRDQAAGTDPRQAQVAGALLALLVALSLVMFAHGGIWRFRPTRKDYIFLITTLFGALLALRGGLFLADALADRMPGVSSYMLYFAIPVGAAVVLVRLVLSSEITLVFAVVLAAFAGLVADYDVVYSIFTLVGGLIAALRVSKARDRTGIWQAGLLMAAANTLLVLVVLFQESRDLGDVYPALISAAVAGAVTPVLVLGLAIVVENVFRYTTDLKLLELANMNNPLLKELVVAAPGTYHHSMMIGTMVESAAEAIGANPLFARVGAYYHDIGKGKNPLYFAENQRGENLHDKLKPNMSALVIRRHVTDGIKMAQAAGLPQPLIDMIPMHHGTRLMVYFYHKAKEEEEKKGDSAPSETDYRYTGPKPRFREAALLMIADSVEAAARTLMEPTTDRLRGLVQKVINSCFADGQFDECNITLKDLHAITRSFVTSLEAIYHSRPEYHQPADKGGEKPKNGERAKTDKYLERSPKSDALKEDEGDEQIPADDRPNHGKGARREAVASSPVAEETSSSANQTNVQRDEDSKATGQNSKVDDSAESGAKKTDGLDDPTTKDVEVLKRLGTG